MIEVEDDYESIASLQNSSSGKTGLDNVGVKTLEEDSKTNSS